MQPEYDRQLLNWQLDSICQCAQDCLAKLKIDSVKSTHARVQIENTQYVLIEFGKRTVRLRPAFPGSMLSPAVSVTVSTVENEPSHENNAGRLEHAVTEWPHLAADLHYSRFHPVSAPPVRPFYNGVHPRIVFFTSKPPALERVLIERLTAFWQSRLRSGKSRDLHVYWSPLGKQTHLTTCAEHAFEKELMHDTIGPLALHERAAIINKSDLVITDNIGTAVDTVLLAVPLGSSRAAPGLSALQSGFMRYLTHKDRCVAVKEQSQALARYISENNEDAFIIASEKELDALLIDHLKLSESAAQTEPSTELHAPIIKPFRAEEHTKSLGASLDSRLHRSRRKWRKFRESPKRFLNDSQHWALKSVKGISR